MRNINVIAVDLGTDAGRIVGIHFDGKRIDSQEIYRFTNTPVTVGGTLHWDVLRLWHEIQHGLQRALDTPAAGLAINSFGMDFGLLDANDQLIGNPVHMRDGRTEGIMDWVFQRAPREVVFQRTGVACASVNTLYQLAYLLQAVPWQLEAARVLLTMPNLLNLWLTGARL